MLNVDVFHGWYLSQEQIVVWQWRGQKKRLIQLLEFFTVR